MPQYMLLIYPPVDTPPRGDEDQRIARWQAFGDALQADGVLLAHGRLQDVHAATTVTVREGETLVSDGPFAETKEFLAGFYLIDCSDLDAAIGYAARMPMNDYGSVEVRPMMYPAGTAPTGMRSRAAA